MVKVTDFCFACMFPESQLCLNYYSIKLNSLGGDMLSQEYFL